LKDEIKELQKEGKSVLISNHILPVIQDIASRVCIISNGRKVIEGTINEVLNKLSSLTLEEAVLKVIKQWLNR